MKGPLIVLLFTTSLLGMNKNIFLEKKDIELLLKVSILQAIENQSKNKILETFEITFQKQININNLLEPYTIKLAQKIQNKLLYDPHYLSRFISLISNPYARESSVEIYKMAQDLPQAYSNYLQARNTYITEGDDMEKIWHDL